MSAGVLRRAAALMRERAEAAVLSPWVAVEGAAGGWWVEHPSTADIAVDLHGENARHIASWHPAVALAVADWLDRIAWTWELDPDLSGRVGGKEALAAARAYLGSDS